MIDIDWFMQQSADKIKVGEALIIDQANGSDDIKDTEIAIHIFAAWANWLNVRLMVKTGMVTLTEDQQHEFDYIRNKFVQFSSYLPPEASRYGVL